MWSSKGMKTFSLWNTNSLTAYFFYRHITLDYEVTGLEFFVPILDSKCQTSNTSDAKAEVCTVSLITDVSVHMKLPNLLPLHKEPLKDGNIFIISWYNPN